MVEQDIEILNLIICIKRTRNYRKLWNIMFSKHNSNPCVEVPIQYQTMFWPTNSKHQCILNSC